MKKAALFAAAFALGLVCGAFIHQIAQVRQTEVLLLGRVRSRLAPLQPARLVQLARHQPADESRLQDQMALLKSQFPEGGWEKALRAAGISSQQFEKRLRDEEQALAWIEETIRPQLSATVEERTDFYRNHGALFSLPTRRRARHIFFAAPEGLSPDVVMQKNELAKAVMERVKKGESIETVATESEDEATRDRGGALNFFSRERILPEIWSALEGQMPESTPFLARSALGFHVIQLMEERPARQKPFPEASAEIAHAIENVKRAAAVASLRQSLGER